MNILSICKRAWGTLVALLFVFGCTNDVDKGLPFQEGLHEVVFHAGWDPETKTVLQEDLSIWWSPGDEISMFTGEGYNGGYRLTSNNIEPSANVDFVGQIDFGSPYYAIYPYNSLNSFDGTDFVIPFWDQIAVEDTFQEGAMKSIAVSSDNHLYFKNVCGGIRFSVENEGITKIQLQTDGFISGFLKFRLNEAGEPECAGEAPYGASGSILIHAPNDVGFQPNKYYYVALPSAQVLNNLQMTFHKKDSSAIWSYSSPVEIHRSAFKMLERVDKGLKFHKDAYENAAVLYSFLPDDIGKENITGIVFNVNDATVTGNQISASVPVYYAVDGTTVNIYTSADLYDISSVAGCFFNGYSALQTLDLSNTIVPNASSFAEMFMNCISLESIIFGDWDTYKVQNMEYMFYRCEKLCSLDLSFMDTEIVNSMRACFSECKCLSSIDLSSFNTSNVTDMSSMFAGCQALSSLDIHSFNTGNVKDMYSMFHLCRRLEFLDLSGFDTSNVTDMSQMFLDCQNLKQLNIASFNTSKVVNFNSMFYGCSAIEDLDLSHFITQTAKNMYFMFGWCTFLKNLDISSFTSESLETVELMFGACHRLQKLDLGAFDVSQVSSQSIGSAIMRTSKSGAVRCIPETRAVLEPTMDDNLSGKVEWMSLSDDISTYEYKRDPNLYYSSDYSKHETVRKISSATKGKGIDIVLMGDVYSDRMIASGQYDADMELAVDAIFAKEPMASFKDYFNIYIVYLVSDNEVIGESTALNAVGSGGGVLAGYATASVPEKYRLLATGNGDLAVQEAIVIINGTASVTGYTNMGAWDFDVNYYDCDYGRGFSSVVVSRGDHNYSDEFKITVAHEFGHSFAKLADEYYTNNTTIGETPAGDLLLHFSRFGWYKNVDITSDPTVIRWSRFLIDDRYLDDGVGVFEGGFEYSNGVWRPSENSIMRHGVEFNAPSRAAIYNRIHKLAYSKDWQFDWEKFVQWDTKNIGLEKRAAKSAMRTYHPHLQHKPFVHVQVNRTEDGRKVINVIMN